MKQDCAHYNDCRRPVATCNAACDMYTPPDNIYFGVNRKGCCSYCVYSMEYRDSLDDCEKCRGCKWTEEKKNWTPQPLHLKPSKRKESK